MIWLALATAMAAPCPDSQPVQAGEVAPCDGVLVPVEQVRELLLVRDTELPKMRAELQLHTDLTAIRLSSLQDQLTIERTALTRYRQILDNPPRARLLWYEHPAFWGVVGAAVGIGVGVSLATN